MGEMADYCLEQVEAFEDLRWRYYHGELTHDNAYDAGIIDDGGYDSSVGYKQIKTCRYCGKQGLTWGHTTNGWRLFEKKTIHKCKNNLLRKPLR